MKPSTIAATHSGFAVCQQRPAFQPGWFQFAPGPQGELGAPGFPYVPLFAEPDMAALM
jgi:hypothetical protein